MSKAFEEISAGLDDAIAHAKGRESAVIVHEPETIDVKAIRKKTGMSQQKFCTVFGISLGTLRHWEQGCVLQEARRGFCCRWWIICRALLCRR